MDYEQILFHATDAVAKITFHRPEKLNAFTFKMLGEIVDALDRYVQPDEGIRVLVFTGAGRAFSAGDDMRGMGGGDPLENIRATHHHIVKRIRALRLPVVAAINGYALGAGFDLALACDFRLAVSTAELGDVRVHRAMNSMSGAAFWLPRMVGVARATEILLLGERMSAQRAWELGLVHRVVPPEEFDRAMDVFCRRLLSLPTKSMGANKACINSGLDHPLGEALDTEAKELIAGFATEDWREGIRAFLEKREPQFKGR